MSKTRYYSIDQTEISRRKLGCGTSIKIANECYTSATLEQATVSGLNRYFLRMKLDVENEKNPNMNSKEIENIDFCLQFFNAESHIHRWSFMGIS